MKHNYRHQIYFTVEKLTKRLQDIQPYLYKTRHPLALEVAPDVTDPKAATWERLPIGGAYGGQNEWRWLRTRAVIPAEWVGRPVAARLILGLPTHPVHVEALVWVNGELRQGVDPNHHEVVLTDHAQGGEAFDLLLRVWTSCFWGTPPTPPQQFLQVAELVELHPPTRQFYHRAEVALGTAQALDNEGAEHQHLLNVLDAAFLALDLRSADGFYTSLPTAAAILEHGLKDATYHSVPAKILATGHAHIDVAWLWRLKNTREKAQHTFGNVLRLMEQYPDFHFTQSQAQLYEYVREDAPSLWDQIKARIKEGRWEVTGGMWVEADCNLASGESFIRQIMVGRAFFREHFGEAVDTPILWLPDTFGYSWALPQIIQRTGLKYFMTSKISWSQYNHLPYDSFRWRGIDGTEVVTHFLTAPGGNDEFSATYNAMVTPDEVAKTWRRYQQKDVHNEVLSIFGYGDGGGGPTLEMLERLDNMADHPGLPQVIQGSAGDFFDRLAEKAPKLPVWNGELYLEYHRGTYTTQARNKQANRKAEVLYHRAEFAAALATLCGQPYPYDALREGWRLILLNQFHDIIPGSSIRAVYEDSAQDYARIFEIGETILRQSIAAIVPFLALPTGEKGLLVFRTAGVLSDQTGLIDLPGDVLGNGQVLMDIDRDHAQFTQRAADALYLFPQTRFNGPSFQVLKIVTGQEPAPDDLLPDARVTATPTTLENSSVRVTFNDLGEIVSLYDKLSDFEVMPPGARGNQLQAFEDRPMRWDAWDVDVFFEHKQYQAEPISATVIDNGPLRASIEFRTRLLNSEIVQRVSLDVLNSRIDFKTVVDWREKHILLKVAFPVNLLATHATFDIQFGNVQRPTHHNTSWDWARFETVAHKWVNLAENGYSVSLLNDCKYGHDVHDNVLRLSLLRSPNWPDPEADQGRQEFTYSLFPNDFALTETIREAYELNDPPQVFVIEGAERGADQPPTPKFSARHTLIAVDMPSIVIETVKAAEDGRGLIIRLYESVRSRGTATIKFGFGIMAAWETNMIETDERELMLKEGDTLTVPFTPYQIRTLRVIPA